jgi:hypothetical protein
MTEIKNVGISKSMFVVGLVVAILASSAIASAILMLYARGPEGFGEPDYDSGWMDIAAGDSMSFTHGLGTTNVHVYVVGRNADGLIHQMDYGFTIAGSARYGLAWLSLDSNSIWVTRGPDDENWVQVRMMIWRLS